MFRRWLSRAKVLQVLKQQYGYSPPMSGLEGWVFKEFTRVAASARVSADQTARDFVSIRQGMYSIGVDAAKDEQIPLRLLLEKFQSALDGMKERKEGNQVNLSSRENLDYGFLLLKSRYLSYSVYCDLHPEYDEWADEP